MNAFQAKNILRQYNGMMDICYVYKAKYMPRNDIDIIKNEYLEFIIVKTLGNDDGLNAAEIKFLPSTQIDEFWKCHILCTEEYDKFMLYVNKINPLLDFIHYTLCLLYTSPSPRDRG